MTAWPWVVLRICCTATAVLVFNQAVFAGQFLGGSFGALHTHRENATAAGIAVLVTAGAAVLVRLRGGGPRWPAYACLGLFALITVQIMAGFARLLTIHVPLGVAIIFLTLLLTGWSWRAAPRGQGPASPSSARAERPGTTPASQDLPPRQQADRADRDPSQNPAPAGRASATPDSHNSPPKGTTHVVEAAEGTTHVVVKAGAGAPDAVAES